MSSNHIFDLIKINEYSATPKYIQLSNSILNGIESGNIKKGDILPSINEVSYELDISRDTIEKGYRLLKAKGVLNSVPGKGYFISNVDFQKTLKIFLLFNKLSAHKKIIYDSFVETLGENVSIDFYIYNNDFFLFKKLLSNRNEDYSYYVIASHFIDGSEHVADIINAIPKEKLILLDKKIPDIKGKYGAVYENFSQDIFKALEKAQDLLAKYKTIKIILPEHSYYPQEIAEGVSSFCSLYHFDFRIVHDISKDEINTGDVFINLMEDDLVVLIERTISLKLEIAKEVGIISYNEVPLKKIILNGLTTVSTDFKMMGKEAANLILNRSTAHIEIPFYLTVRHSL